jgi:hypothetical protein
LIRDWLPPPGVPGGVAWVDFDVGGNVEAITVGDASVGWALLDEPRTGMYDANLCGQATRIHITGSRRRFGNSLVRRQRRLAHFPTNKAILATMGGCENTLVATLPWLALVLRGAIYPSGTGMRPARDSFR